MNKSYESAETAFKGLAAERQAEIQAAVAKAVAEAEAKAAKKVKQMSEAQIIKALVAQQLEAKGLKKPRASGEGSVRGDGMGYTFTALVKDAGLKVGDEVSYCMGGKKRQDLVFKAKIALNEDNGVYSAEAASVSYKIGAKAYRVDTIKSADSWRMGLIKDMAKYALGRYNEWVEEKKPKNHLNDTPLKKISSVGADYTILNYIYITRLQKYASEVEGVKSEISSHRSGSEKGSVAPSEPIADEAEVEEEEAEEEAEEEEKPVVVAAKPRGRPKKVKE